MVFFRLLYNIFVLNMLSPTHFITVLPIQNVL